MSAFSVPNARYPRNSGGPRDRREELGRKRATTISSDGKDHATGRSHDSATFANAVGYLRVSTDEQADSGLGIEAQRASITAAAARLGLHLREVFTDAGVSGSLPLADRPALLQAVTALHRGDVLLVAKRDRLGRDLLEVAMIERLVKKKRARSLSAAGEGTENDEPANIMFRFLIDAFAEYERLMTAARTKAGLAAKRAKGERAGTLPFGYQLAEGSRQRLAPAPIEQRLMARVRELSALGRSLRQNAETLNAEGWRHTLALSVRRTPAPR